MPAARAIGISALLDLVSLRWLGERIRMRINKLHGERLGTLATTISERKGTERIGTDRIGSERIERQTLVKAACLANCYLLNPIRSPDP